MSETSHPFTHKSSVNVIVNKIAASLQHLSPGDLADLRRGSPDDPGGPTFWKIAIRFDLFGESAGLDVERKWIAILAILADLEGLHRPGRHLGEALAGAGISELRLVRLLRARGGQLLDEARVASKYLAAKGESVDVSGLAHLILSEGGGDGERTRNRIARSYFANIGDS